MRETVPEASVVAPALLHRKNLEPDEIVREFNALEAGEDNRFTGTADWIHNNFVGCFLQLYAPYDRACPLYAGFDTSILLARGNLRHFLELCHKSLKCADIGEDPSKLRIEPTEQAESARQASIEFLREVRTFGRLGNRLHAFVLTLGSIFALAHRRPAQSEPEIGHFSVRGGPGALGEDETDFLAEAIKWSVLIEYAETKVKDQLQAEGREWQLNPIYSPYFHITYRKGRKIEFTVDEVSRMIGGNEKSRQRLLKDFMERWSMSADDVEKNLFSHLEEGE